MANLPANKAKGTVTKNKLDEIVEHEPEGGQYPTPVIGFFNVFSMIRFL